MKTPATAAVLLLSLHSPLWADIREITPETIAELGWKIGVSAIEDYVAFTVQPPEPLLSQGRTALLGVRHNDQVMVVCILGLQEIRAGRRYEFSVSRQHLQDSSFELSKAAASDDGEQFRMRLRTFVEESEKNASAKALEDVSMTNQLRENYIAPKNTQAWLGAKKAWVADLRKRYGGIDASLNGRDAREHADRFSRLMREWSPLLCSVKDLKSIAKPRNDSPNMIEYFFDTGEAGSGYRFNLQDDTIVGIEYLEGE